MYKKDLLSFKKLRHSDAGRTLGRYYAFLHDIDPDYDEWRAHRTCSSPIAMRAPAGRMSHLLIFPADHMICRNPYLRRYSRSY